MVGVQQWAEAKLDPFKAEIARLLREDPDLPGVRVGELLAPLGWDGGRTILDDYLREVRPLFQSVRTTQRTIFRPGENCPFDVWQPRAAVPSATASCCARRQLGPRPHAGDAPGRLGPRLLAASWPAGLPQASHSGMTCRPLACMDALQAHRGRALRAGKLRDARVFWSFAVRRKTRRPPPGPAICRQGSQTRKCAFWEALRTLLQGCADVRAANRAFRGSAGDAEQMARPGLEPGTPRFSVVCSTN